MGTYKQFADDLNELARGAMAAVIAASADLETAQANAKQYPMHGAMTENYSRQAIDAAQALNKAKDKHSAAMQGMTEALNKMQQMREKLAQRLRDDFFPYGKEIDADELRVLDSGILTAEELLYMYEVEEKCGNRTMMRIIGKHAAELAKKYDGAANTAEDHIRAAKLQAVALDAKKDRAGEVLEEFDNLVETFSRTVSNTAMIPQWANLTQPFIDMF